ncbi:hypothetical protein ACGFYU_23265 [Streptomyces sp. NPDC048337]|uniref:hypothetical protein n=1 Tax=Streptomyces sp. NPDC048337 TaxID=3365535 RepID=UPI00371CC9ED
MNCIGPTARSERASPSNAPPSVSGMFAKPLPSSTGPRIGRSVVPAVSTRPPRACPDSTLPIAARSCQRSPHPGSLSPTVFSARRYAASTLAGIPCAAVPVAAGSPVTAAVCSAGAFGAAAPSSVARGTACGAGLTRGGSSVK